jgi:hypothetical protein
LSQQLQIVESRQHQLDEFERLNPEGFAAWLASEPRATGDLIPFVLGNHDRDLSPINWDGLITEPTDDARHRASHGQVAPTRLSCHGGALHIADQSASGRGRTRIRQSSR